MNMRINKKKTAEILRTAVITAGLFMCIIRPQSAGAAAARGVGRCIGVIIPSLYAVMVMSQLFIRSGAIDKAAPFFSFVGRIFGMKGDEFGIFIFSMLAGYPVGAKMLCGRVEQGSLTPRRASWLCGLSFGAGPAFISGCIASQLYGSPWTGRTVMLSCVTANLVLGLLCSPVLPRDIPSPTKGTSHCWNDGLLTKCVSDSGRSVAEICFAVVFFSVFSEMILSCGAVHKLLEAAAEFTGCPDMCILALAGAFFDITAAVELPRGDFSLLPVISALVSFGGICVLFQIKTVVHGIIPLKNVVLMRIAAGVLSYISCRMIMPFFISGKIVEAAAITPKVHKAESPVPSVLLIIMTVWLISHSEKAH